LPEEWIITSPLSIEAGREAMRQILTLPERPKAVFLNNNVLSLGALLAIRELGLRCPDDVSVVGFDDHPWAAVSDPPLTVVRQPAQKLGRVAAQMVLALINGEQPPEPRVILECEMIGRRSSCPPP
jgi:DNA-binding LacI/PurR family transcriptional regulator